MLKKIISIVVIATLLNEPYLHAMHMPQQAQHESRMHRIARLAWSDCKEGIKNFSKKIKPYYSDPVIAVGLGIIALTSTAFLGFMLGHQQAEQRRLSNLQPELKPANDNVSIPDNTPPAPIANIEGFSIPANYLARQPIVIQTNNEKLIVAQVQVISQFINVRGTPTCSLHSLKNIIALLRALLNHNAQDNSPLEDLTDLNFVTTMIDDINSEWNQLVRQEQVATLQAAQQHAYERKYPQLHAHFPDLFPDLNFVIPMELLTQEQKNALRTVCYPSPEQLKEEDFINMYPALHADHPTLFADPIIPKDALTAEQQTALRQKCQSLDGLGDIYYKEQYIELHLKNPTLFPEPEKLRTELTEEQKEVFLRKIRRPQFDDLQGKSYRQKYIDLHNENPDLFPYNNVTPLMELNKEQRKAVKNLYKQTKYDNYPAVSLTKYAARCGQPLAARYFNKQEIQLLIDYCKAQGQIDRDRNIHIFSSINELDEKNCRTQESLNNLQQALAELSLPGVHTLIIGDMMPGRAEQGHWIALVINRRVDPITEQQITEYIIADSINNNAAIYNETVTKLIELIDSTSFRPYALELIKLSNKTKKSKT